MTNGTPAVSPFEAHIDRLEYRLAENEFQEKTNRFLKWLTKLPKVRISSGIILSDLRGQGRGRGVVAATDIAEDEELFFVSYESIITSETSHLAKVAPELLADLDPWMKLVLVLIYECLRGSASQWSPYLDILPRQMNTLIFWSEEELAELQGSAVIGKIGKAEADSMFRLQILPRIQARPDLFSVDSIPFPKSSNIAESETQILALAHIMATIMLAYSFDVDGDCDVTASDGRGSGGDDHDDGLVTDDEDEDTFVQKAMIPMADMLNADADRANARLFQEDDGISIRAVCAIAEGQEILNDYGPLPRSDLLRRYGYTTEAYAQYDVVEIPLTQVVEMAQLSCTKIGLSTYEQETRLEYLRSHDLLEDDFDITNSGPASSPFSEGLIITTEVLLLKDSDFARLRSRDALPDPQLSPDVASVLESVLVTREAGYATTLEEDEVVCRRGVAGRTRLAMEVRMGEKTILKEALRGLRKFLSNTDAQKRKRHSNNPTYEAANKRRRSLSA